MNFILGQNTGDQYDKRLIVISFDRINAIRANLVCTSVEDYPDDNGIRSWCRFRVRQQSLTIQHSLLDVGQCMMVTEEAPHA